MQERYGLDRRPVGRWLAIGLLLAAFVAALAFVAVGVTGNPIDSRMVAWEAVAADHIDMTIQVKRPAELEVTCALRAQDARRIDVGYATLVVPPGEAEVLLDYPLRTLAPASTAELLGCSADGLPNVPPPQFPPGVVPPEQPWS